MELGKKTRLYGWHVAHGAHLAEFGGYQMPLWYTAGTRAEHLAVISAAGIFDTSHMAAVSVTGPEARLLLERCFTRNLGGESAKGALTLGRCLYGLFLNDDGTVIDDAIVYQLAAERYLVVVNAGMGGPVAAHLTANRQDMAVEVTDRTDHLGKLDLQGPAAVAILAGLLKDPAAALGGLGYFAFRGSLAELGGGQPQGTIALDDGTELLVSRTGYTGEQGFEIFTAIDKLETVWKRLIAAGQAHGLLPCGLAARDSLRVGAGLPLSHQDIGPWPFLHNPWQFALPWLPDRRSFSKDFIGASALLKSNWPKHTLAFAGFDPRKVPAGPGSLVLSQEGENYGTILTCTTDMAIDRQDGEIISLAAGPARPVKGLCCGFVLVDRLLPPGSRVWLSDGRRRVEVEIRTDIRPERTARRVLHLPNDNRLRVEGGEA
jgi:aminomethyltransferase